MLHRSARRHPPSGTSEAEAPISRLDTTPLIDVMLVLLIMFIVTIPMATHGIELDLPSRGQLPAKDQEHHQLRLDRAGRLSFDGAPIGAAALALRLRDVVAKDPQSVLHFRIDGDARYDDFDRTLAVVKRAGIARLGLVGNEAFVGALPH